MQRFALSIISLILIFTAAQAYSAGGQELLRDVDEDSLGTHAADLVSRVKNGVDQSLELQAKMARAGSEDSLVLELRFFEP